MKTFRNTPASHLSVIILLAIMITSCGDKDDNKKDERSPRLNQMIFHYVSDNSQWENSDSVLFQYNNNNQLIAMVGLASEDSVSIQYNSEGRISEAVYINSDGEFNTMNYSWSGNRMTMTETVYADAKAVFEINSEGRVVRTETYFLNLNEGQWHMVRYILYNWAEGNLVSTETWQSYSKSGTHQLRPHHFPFVWPELQRPASNSENIVLLKSDFRKDSEVFYTYDNKNNPYKDIQLYKFSGMAQYSSANNVLSSVRNGFNSSGEVYETYTDNYIFTYNPENYPLVRSESDFDWTITETYLYE
jgi:hypothetical protein